MGDRRVLVVGGGVTGLSAAVSLLDQHGYDVELWDSAPDLGGKIASSSFAGLDHIDEGADAYLTRVPAAVEFATRLGITDLTVADRRIGRRVARRIASDPGRHRARHARRDPAVRDDLAAQLAWQGSRRGRAAAPAS